MTEGEIASAAGFIDAYNSAIEAAALEHSVTVVDMAAAWWAEGNFGAYSGLHPVQEPEKSTFSLDGVHPNNLGHALCANKLITVMNSTFDLDIPELTLDDYAGQYSTTSMSAASIGPLKYVREQWR